MDLMERKAIEDAALAKELHERLPAITLPYIAGKPEDGCAPYQPSEAAEREHEMELQEIQLSDHELYERHRALLADELYEKEGDR